MNRLKIKKVVGGMRYDTENATLIADDVFWDGSNFERNGRNTWLYRTPLGAFFKVEGTFWQGERDDLTPLSASEARDLYEYLPEHSVEYEEIFGEPVEPTADSGRPSLYGAKMIQTAVHLTAAQIAWLKEQAEGVSATVRRLIDQEMQS